MMTCDRGHTMPSSKAGESYLILTPFSPANNTTQDGVLELSLRRCRPVNPTARPHHKPGRKVIFYPSGQAFFFRD